MRRRVGPNSARSPNRLTGPGHGATPVGGENGGRHTVRLRGGRAGSVTQESLVVFAASYQRVMRNRQGRLLSSPMLPDRGYIRRGQQQNYSRFL